MDFDVDHDGEQELSIPAIWRPTLCKIVDFFKAGDFRIDEIPNVEPLDTRVAKMIKNSISYYGDPLISLPIQAWDTSVYRWAADHWEVMVDLFTTNEGLSDLTLFVDVRKDDEEYKFQVQSIHVP